MNKIFTKISEVDSNNSEAVKDALSSLFQNLLKHASIESFKCLRVLEDVLNRFPKYCASNRVTIETYLAHFIDSTNYYNVIEAAKCAHILQQVRPPQEKTANAKICWREHQIVLCNEAHQLISELFPNSVHLYRSGDSGQKTQLQSTGDSPLYAALKATGTTRKKDVNKQHSLSTKLKNALVFLQAMLVEPYPVAKPIQPQTILEVIVRALSASSAAKTTLDAATISSIKVETLRTLDALVACLGANLIPFSSLIFKLVLQTLHWSSENVSDESSKVRCRAYESAARWIRVGGGRKAGVDDLALHAIADVAPPRRLMQLTMSSQPTKHLSKKAKRKLTNRMLQESSISAHMPTERNKAPVSGQTSDELSVAALDLAEALLTTCGAFMTPSTHKMFMERLVRECYQLDHSGGERALGLLRALEAGRRGAPPGASPPTQYCLQLFSMLLAHRDSQISTFAAQALLEIRLHLHCSPQSISFAIPPQDKQKQVEKRKRVSERNKAALEALLGRDRISESESIEDEVIDISDEPTNKKTRNSTNEDKISVSSDSMDSVVIQEDLNGDEEETPTVNGGNNKRDDETCIEIEDVANPEIDGREIMNNGDIVVNLDNDTETPSMVEKGVELSQSSLDNIHDAKTQLPINTSDDTVDGDRSPLSMEVGYDFPNASKENVTVLEKVEDENLPSTNDTDDVQITCGQLVKSSQDAEIEKVKENGIKMNGDRSPAKINQEENVTSKISAINEINVDDMLADFVDEVNEETVKAT